MNTIRHKAVHSMTSDPKNITTSMINFAKNNVLSITELTRKNKLSEILETFNDQKSEEIFLVKSGRQRDSMGAIINVEFLTELLQLRDKYYEAMDKAVEATALQRLETFEPNVSLAHALDEIGVTDINLQEIQDMADELEI
ncbi:hypothetical protein NSS64_03405 [Paenibacillus sp. FSL H8-0122]|uniref:hypothetical protein n=1 Tax=unclassified Paenibacillus TaxID=185978 RepID=UPI00096DA873|nr:hypothetical protein BK146_14635 [Paenibacillus sp. FSL R7-0333]